MADEILRRRISEPCLHFTAENLFSPVISAIDKLFSLIVRNLTENIELNQSYEVKSRKIGIQTSIFSYFFLFTR